MKMTKKKDKLYVIKHVNGMYYRTRLGKGHWHFAFELENATRLTRTEANKLISELRHKEKYEIMEVEDGK